MKWRRLHELTAWDERAIFRSREGARMRGQHSDEAWRAILQDHRSPPGPVPVAVTIEDARILLEPTEAADQLQLGAIVAALSHLVVTNRVVRIDPRLPFRLWPMLGTEAFTKANSWRRHSWRTPLELARTGQRYPLGWDALHAALRAETRRVFMVPELSAIATPCIANSLPDDERHAFWMANR